MQRYINSPLVKYLLGLIEFILAIGLIMRFLGASAQAPFVATLYTLVDAFAAPFQGIFPDSHLGHGGVFDASIFSAIFIYAIFVGIPIFLHKRYQQDKPADKDLEEFDDIMPPV
jgi:hypothetical protein